MTIGKRNRQSLPGGHIIGFLGPKGSVGTERPLDLRDVANYLARTGLVSGGTALTHMFLGVNTTGLFAANQSFAVSIAPEDVTFPSSDPQDFASAEFPATNTTDMFLTSNLANFLFDGSDLICTVTFPAGGGSPTFTWNGSTTVNQGDILHLVCDSTPDPNLSSVQILFSGDIV